MRQTTSDEQERIKCKKQLDRMRRACQDIKKQLDDIKKKMKDDEERMMLRAAELSRRTKRDIQRRERCKENLALIKEIEREKRRKSKQRREKKWPLL